MKRPTHSENPFSGRAELLNALNHAASVSMDEKKLSTVKPLLTVAFFLLTLLPSLVFSQGCPNNFGFEDSSTVGWTCKLGYYGAGACPQPVTGVCPTFSTVLNICPQDNANGINAPLNTGVDRQTIVSNQFNGGTGKDPNSGIPLIPVVDPLIPGNQYSFRLGDDVTGGTNTTACYTGTCNGPGCYSRAEAIRLTFLVDATNAGFHYHYSVFLANGGHLPEEQPRFEVLVTQPDSGDQLIPCGYYKVVANNSNPYCPGVSTTFHTNGIWQYSDWTDVALDLSSYQGQHIAIEFRTSDCFPGSGILTSITGSCTTTIQNGDTCVTAPSLAACPDSGQCRGTLTCSNTPGSHSAYAYIDAVCGPSLLAGFNPHVCIGPSVTIHAPTGFSSYSWLPINVSSSSDSVVVSNPVAGTTYTVNMVSVTGCPATTTITLHASTATVHDTAFCVGAPGNYNLNLTYSTSQPPLFQWASPGNPNLSTLQNPSIPIPAVTTTYTVTVTDTATTCAVVKTETININPLPTITITPSSQICPGATAVINATAGGGTYLWSTVPPSTDSTISVTPLLTTTYIVTVTNASGCIDTASSTVTVIPLPPVNAVPLPSAICAGASTQITTPSIPGATYSWLQSGTGTIVPPTSNAPVVTPSGNETYTVIVTDLGCSASGTCSVTVNPNPTPTANSTPPAICIGANTQLGTTGGPWANCVWTGAGNPVGCTPTVTPIATGQFPYSVTVTDANTCTGTASVTITVNGLPTVTATQHLSVCQGTDALFIASGGTTYTWLPSAALNLSGANTDSLTVFGPPVGTFTFTVAVLDNNGCAGADTTSLTVNQPPIVTINPPAAVCQGFSTLLSASGGGLYSWLPGGAINDTVTVAPNVTTVYFVTVTNPVDGCISTDSATVTVNPHPSIPNIPNASVCIGACTTFNGTTQNAAVYSWLPGPMTPTLTVCPLTVTTQTYTLYVASSSGCLDSATVQLTSNALPIVTVSPPDSICAGDCSPLTASANVGVASCSWIGANLNNSANCNPSACPATVGLNSYLVTLTDINGCVDTASAYITVNPKPVIAITSNPLNLTICQDSSASLTATGAGPGGTYLWTGGGLSSPTTATTTATPLNSGLNTYVVVGTNSNNCTNSQTVTINVVPPPTVNVNSPNICIGECTPLNASGGLYYTWSPDPSLSASSLNLPNPTVCPSATTTYTITVSNGGNCPAATDTAVVTVHPIPPIMVGTDTTILAGDTATLTAVGGGITYNWSPETGLNCSTCPNVFAYPLSTTLYFVTTTDSFGCRNTDSVLVKVDDVLTLYVPSAFTPDSRDDINTILYAYGIGIYKFEFYVFDRWGTEMFESTSPYVGWDGTYRGQKVQQDVYVYLAKARSITGKSITKTGAVTVVK